MLVKIETQSRKRAKLTRYFDVMDFQILLITGLVIPFSLWMIAGVTYYYTFWMVLSYIVWMALFKIDKPSGYWNHWLNYRLRGKFWTGYHQDPNPIYKKLKKD
jgi:hypothetical protein